MASYEELQESVINGQQEKAKELANTLLVGGNRPAEILSYGLMRGIDVVGQRFKIGEMFIPEVLASAQALSGAMEVLKPAVVGSELSDMYLGKVVIGTVQGDVHNIGKNIVALLLRSVGFEVVDIGVDVSAEKFVAMVEKEQANMVALSAMLTSTMPRMNDVIDMLQNKGLRDKVKVLVGGAPVTQNFAYSIGADGYAPDAITALDKAKQLVGKH